jgi:mutator protein MutT
MIYLEKPTDFNLRFEIVSCFCEYSGKIVLLQRHDHKSEGNTWGVPAGKLDENETLKQAIKRELEEETGIKAKKLKYFRKVFVRYPDYDYVYHIFSMKAVDGKVTINDKEHKNFTWIEPENALKMNLIQDLDGCIKLFYGLN